MIELRYVFFLYFTALRSGILLLQLSPLIRFRNAPYSKGASGLMAPSFRQGYSHG